MIDISKAIQFIDRRANPQERLRLHFLQTGQPPLEVALQDFQAAQRADGGWPPFWAPQVSSVDATCFRLAQAEQMGLDPTRHALLARSLDFLASRQQPEGFWEEDPSVSEAAPPWARPGDLTASLYLTSNAGYWLSRTRQFLHQAAQAGRFISAHLAGDGSLPSFPQTHWLSAALLDQVGQSAEADRICSLLLAKVDSFSSSELTWLLNALASVQTGSSGALTERAISRLLSLQLEDGHWASDDGPFFDVHTTLEALFVLVRSKQIRLDA